MPDALAHERPVVREWSTFRAATPRAQVFLALTTLAALVAPWLLDNALDATTSARQLLTLLILVSVSVLNVEVGRRLTGGLEETHQPHKALSAWAFATALLLPSEWLLVVVPLTYAHTWWRGMRITLWKWVGSAGFMVLSGCLAQWVAMSVMGDTINYMLGNGGRGLVAALLAAAAFLLLESVLFWCPASLNHREDEVWLRATLRSPSFYGTEAAVLLIGALFSAAWTGGAWFVLLTVPIYVVTQRAILHEPLRLRAESATLLAQQNAELEQANQFQSDLMAMLGHEIGNPLTSVMGYTEVGLEALDAGDTAFAREALGIVERGATQVQGVLNDVLALVASDRRALLAMPEAFSVAPRLDSAAAHQPPQARPTVDCPADLTAYAQPSHVDQMVANLLSNARKYAGGATRIAASRVDDRVVEITVADAGPGIPEDFRTNLFERFSRDVASSRGVRGTGLGLFITRELARANGGTVELRETGPSGSVFAIRVPSAPPA